MRYIALCAAVLIGGMFFLSRASADNTTAALKPGDVAPSFRLQDQNGKEVSLADFPNKVVVLEWTNSGCPFVQRHYASKTFTTLSNEYKDKGVVWIAINSTRDDTQGANKTWAQSHDVQYPILDDASGATGHAYDAKTTPDMYVLNKDHRIVYMGAIDNDPEGNKGEGKIDYVQRALDEVLAGKTVSIPQTKSYGCGVKYAN